ncbi:MAG: dihydropteroate synthase [Pseudomonadota bacterium]
MTADSLQCGPRTLDLSKPAVMGILNVTPDSFSDGGCLNTLDRVVDVAAAMVDDGAQILDIGGESTRPGAQAVSNDEELARVIPAIEQLSDRFDVVLSADTSKAVVMQAAVGAGATMINDVCALSADGSLEAAAASDAAVCLMHMRGQPRTMQIAPHYDNVVAEVRAFLEDRVAQCLNAGIGAGRICIDPGYGFGKTLEHNLQITARLDEISLPDLPILFGASRKSSIGQLLNVSVDDRLIGSVAMAILAVERGARIVRVHDVRETVQAIDIVTAVRGACSSAPN